MMIMTRIRFYLIVLCCDVTNTYRIPTFSLIVPLPSSTPFTMSCKKYSSLFFLINIHLLATSASNSTDMLYEINSIVRVYRDGRVLRLSGTEIVPPSFDPTTGVLSKDVDIDPKLNISARLFLPQNATVFHKLPLLVYFHGGAFFTDSPFSPTYHNHLNSLVSVANVVAVSVNYRLAPEHLLPIAYEDSWAAVKWVFSNLKGNGSEVWLKKYADFGRVYLGGDSAGGNIAHNMGIRVGLDEGIRVYGMFLNCPHFWGNKRIGKEGADPSGMAWIESIWSHAYPNSTGFDDPLSNPAKDPNLGKLGSKKVVVNVGELDVLRDRAWYYEKALKESKWDGSVTVVEAKGQGHSFFLCSPNSLETKNMITRLALFLNDKQTSVAVF